MLMLCFVAQYAEAFKITAKKVQLPENDNNTIFWIIAVVVGLAILLWLYNNSSKIKSLFRFFHGNIQMAKETDLTEDQQRKVLLSGVFSAQKSALMNTIKTGMDREERQTMLAKGWGIPNKESAIDTLNYLEHAGTRRFFPQVVEALKLKNKKAIQQYLADTFQNEGDIRACWEQVQYAFGSIDSLMKEQIIKDEADFVRIGPDAWDAGRLVFMARLCREQDYITDEQMWQYIDAADEIAHRTFTCWEDFGKSYIIGRCLWCGTANYFEVMAGHARDMYSNPKSPWKSIRF